MNEDTFRVDLALPLLQIKDVLLATQEHHFREVGMIDLHMATSLE